jgi:ABC-type transport system involved in multi-copper enzyme maturation permease subunit
MQIAKTPSPSLSQRLRSNPVVVKELRGRMRGSRAFWILTAYLLLLCTGFALVFLGFTAAATSGGGAFPRPALGRTAFGVVIALELITVSFLAPAQTAGAISAEREQQTYDLLRTTMLSARALILGKLFAGLAFIFLLLFSALPLQSLALFLGGVSTVELFVANLLLVVTALSFAAVGLFFSSFNRRTLASTILSYAFAILLVFGLPVLLAVSLGLFNAILFGSQQANLFAEAALILVGLFFISINPVAAAIVAEILWIEEGSLFTFALPVSQDSSFLIISPWLPFTILHLALTAVLIWLSIRFVRRAEA